MQARYTKPSGNRTYVKSATRTSIGCLDLQSLHQIRVRLVAVFRIGGMHHASLAPTGQTCLSHDTPDSLVIDLPAGTKQGFGHTTIAIESLDFTNLLYSSTQPLIVFLVS